MTDSLESLQSIRQLSTHQPHKTLHRHWRQSKHGESPLRLRPHPLHSPLCLR